MAITYDFIVYSRRISATGWVLGMKALHGEVPLDIVIPDQKGTPDAENREVVNVLTTEGLERESPEGLELYRYLRQLNPKKNDTFGYNEVVIRNIHSRLTALRVDQEIRIQVTYMERREPYPLSSYQMKLIGVFENPPVTDELDETGELPDLIPPEDTEETEETPEPQEQEQAAPQRLNHEIKPAYKTTNTLEKLIDFTQNLQKELEQTRKELSNAIHKIRQLEETQQQISDIQEVLQEVFDRLERLDRLDPRMQSLEADRHLLRDLQHAFQRFLAAVHHQTHLSLQECNEDTEPPGNRRY